MSNKYFIKGSALAGPITPPQSPDSGASPTLSPELLAKIEGSVKGQLVQFSSKTMRRLDYGKETVIEKSPSEMSLEPKKVHWKPSVQDNEGKTTRKPLPRQTRYEDKTTALPFKSHRRPRTPTVPDPPRSRGPPPAPRPRRLPTPELPDVKCDDFCDCCYTPPTSKMNAQLLAAASHIAKTRELPRRLT